MRSSPRPTGFSLARPRARSRFSASQYDAAVSTSEASRKQLYSSWLVWVKANLGRDNRLAAIAATEALEHGSDFSGASEAARSAWIGAAGGADPAPWSGPPPLAILVAMGIAIGGAAVSAAFDLWAVVVGHPYMSLLVQLFVICNLILVALNTWFLSAMWLLWPTPSRQWVGIDSPTVRIYDLMRRP